MIKFITVKFVIIAVLILSIPTDSNAQKRIRFKRGKSSTTLTGRVKPNAVREFVIGVGRGQTIIVHITRGKTAFDLEVTGRKGHVAWGKSGYVAVKTNYKGDYFIAIKNAKRASRNYKMKVSVVN